MRLGPLLCTCLCALACQTAPASVTSPSPDEDRAAVHAELDPPAVKLGRALYRETRFSQYSYVHRAGDVNAVLPAGDPVVEWVETTGAPAAGPYRGKAMSCAGCHFLGEFQSTLGMRAYTDFARRSPKPSRNGESLHAPRNAPSMVGVLKPRSVPLLLHFDGELGDPKALVIGSMTSPSFGWDVDEANIARANLVAVVREDQGMAILEPAVAGLSYRVLFAGVDAAIPLTYRLPPSLRLDVTTATDAQILDAVASLVALYMQNLTFAQNDFGMYVGSPYDQFILANGLPAKLSMGQTTEGYVQELRQGLDALQSPTFIVDGDLGFSLHPGQPFSFDAQALAGLRLFLGRAGCAGCHPPPEMTDFSLHNTGSAQDDYDSVHGEGTFNTLPVPDLATRTANPDAYLPKNPTRPAGRDTFRSFPTQDQPSRADLGAWNIVANPDYPATQDALSDMLCPQGCSQDELLSRSFATFKTPSLRDLADGGPYGHSGRFDTFGDVVKRYVRAHELALAGQLRSADPRIAAMDLREEDVDALVAFLWALTEDYQ